jgi:RNA polymerase sigma-70 factor (ECF subfamily)
MGRLTLATPRRRRVSGERFLRTFASVRAELIQAVLRLLGSPEDAQDVAQEAFLKCWRTRDRLDKVRDLRAWIFRVGLNTARDLRRNVWRQRSRPLPDPLDCDPAGPCPSEEVLRGEELERLRAAVVGLRPEEREVFLLRQKSTLTYEEIARHLRIPAGTAKTLMRAALGKLRAVLQEK